MNAQNLMLFLSCKYHGNWDDIYSAVKRKEPVKGEEVEKFAEEFNGKVICLLDDDYPTRLKQSYKPPFLIHYKGDFSLIKKNSILISTSEADYTNPMSKETLTLVQKIITNTTPVIMLKNNNDASVIRLAIENNIPFIALYNGEERFSHSIIKEIEECNIPHLILSETDFNAEKVVNSRFLVGFLDKVLLLDTQKDDSTAIKYLREIMLNNGDVYCLPSDNLNNSFNNELIKLGATLVNTPEDIVNA